MADTHRFFVAAPEVYESIRLQLDAAWGHGPGTGTLTCYTPVAEVPGGVDGNVTLAVRREFCEYTVASEVLPQLLKDGLVTEITRAECLARQ